MNGILGMFSSARDTLHGMSLPIHLKKTNINPLIDAETLFVSESETFYKFDPSKDENALHVLREGHIEVTLQDDRRVIVPLILISEPLVYEGCDWKNAGTPVHHKKSSGGLMRNSRDNQTFSLKGDKDLKSKDAEELTAKPMATAIQMTGLKEFLSQFGVTPTSAPLFPEGPENEVEKKAANPPKTSAFLQKLKNPAAADIVKSLKGFINTFQYQPGGSMQEQGVIVRSYLNGLEEQVMEHALWKDSTEDELDSISDGLEKFVMTKLYEYTFVKGSESQENLDLYNRIQEMQFLTPQHLDMGHVRLDVSFDLACNELKKINGYKTPRDKLVCVLNCCKVIYNLLNKVNPEASFGADDFLPVLIYVILRANPQFLHTNIQYINSFRNPDKMMTEAGYYFTHLVSAVTFIQNLDASVLSIEPEEFNQLVEKGREGGSTGTSTPNEGTKISPSRSVSSDLSQDEDASEELTFQTRGDNFFLNAVAEDLKLGDVALLLQEYKRLYHENARLKFDKDTF
eukprot:TRINITY_DN9979_c0_g1_i1.p1 TRINITY_DN9979_c0_g1~~TRINITY_DN9979_c0_g1_i1.p1  ORF type:complete len:587 (-),score=159.24 TRINITY_DN9979_c0_g1_i1:6-1547(-)